MTLYVIYQPGCAACASMEPIITNAEHNGLTVIRRNVFMEPSVMDYTPRGTPGFALVDRGVLVRTADGAMNQREFDHFLDLSYEEPRRRRKPAAAAAAAGVASKRKAAAAARKSRREEEEGGVEEDAE